MQPKKPICRIPLEAVGFSFSGSGLRRVWRMFCRVTAWQAIEALNIAESQAQATTRRMKRNPANATTRIMRKGSK